VATHGTKARFYYGAFDMSGYAEQVAVQLSRSFPEYRPLNGVAVRRPAGGHMDGSIALTGGAMEGPNSAHAWEQLQSGVTNAWAYLPGGDALARLAILGQSKGQNQQYVAGDDIVRLPVALVSTETLDTGEILRALSYGGVSPGPSSDNTVPTDNGGAGYLICTANTGNLDVAIQHSANNVDWTDLLAFTQIAAGATGSQVKVVSPDTAVYRYLRATWTISAAATFFVAFARRYKTHGNPWY
jgi:hypothetical protein